MKKLTAIQTEAVTAYGKFLSAGMSYGDAMRDAAKSLGGTACPTFLEALAAVHATKYKCNYTWNTAGSAVFYTGAESTRESRMDSARKSWDRNVMVWFKADKPKKPATSKRLSADAKALAMDFLGNFEGDTLEKQIKAAIALLNAMK